jgi:hypothetical protein
MAEDERPMERSGRTATFEEAKAKFSASWEAWKAWAGLVERESEERRLSEACLLKARKQ